MKQTLTVPWPVPVNVGDGIALSYPRPQWWNLFRLWRYWRNPLRGQLWKVVAVEGSTIKIESQLSEL